MSCCQQPEKKSSCCPSGDAAGKHMHEAVKEYYGKVLSSTKDVKTSACVPSEKPHPLMLDALKGVPQEITDKFYGCGNPVPLGIDGLHVLDLGSGSGRDCYIAAKLVGPNGTVTGIDMTEEQLEVAWAHVSAYTKTLGYPKPNLRFVQGYIEQLDKAGIKPNSLDLVISNCVVNLSPDKLSVLKQVYTALKTGGEFYFSDVYCDRRLPEEVKKHDVLVGECIGGALYVEDFKRFCRQVGFTDPRIMHEAPIAVTHPDLVDLIGNAKFTSITFRLFKLENLETLCEDYGQVATYKGTIPGLKHHYVLDNHHVFYTNKPMLVCGNSAAMVGESWLAKHFVIQGDRSVHYGLFPCGPPSAATPVAAGSSSAAPSASAACCSSGGGCC